MNGINEEEQGWVITAHSQAYMGAILVLTIYILVVLSVFTAFQRLVLHLNNLFVLASTFKSIDSSSSTEEKE